MKAILRCACNRMWCGYCNRYYSLFRMTRSERTSHAYLTADRIELEDPKPEDDHGGFLFFFSRFHPPFSAVPLFLWPLSNVLSFSRTTVTVLPYFPPFPPMADGEAEEDPEAAGEGEPKYRSFKLFIALPALREVSTFLACDVIAACRGSMVFHFAPDVAVAMLAPEVKGFDVAGNSGSSITKAGKSPNAQSSHGQSVWR